MQVLESMISENFSDSIIINNLSKLQHAQITMNEKLNNIFAQGITNNSNIQQQKRLAYRKESESSSKPVVAK